LRYFFNVILKYTYFPSGMKLDRRIEEAVPAGQQLHELGMRLRCDDASSDQVSINKKLQKISYKIDFNNSSYRMIYWTKID
jgi:hypothetical protein